VLRTRGLLSMPLWWKWQEQHVVQQAATPLVTPAVVLPRGPLTTLADVRGLAGGDRHAVFFDGYWVLTSLESAPIFGPRLERRL
jgi:hypothetical protein